MSSSLFSALSGMRANQQWIDIIGNNLANANTAGYKSKRATFSAAMSQNLAFATAPGNGSGGTNPSQLGLGVQSVHSQRIFSQGSLDTTGRVLDLALSGNGYFSVNNGAENLYSRAGAFGLDADNSLVDLVTGFQVNDVNGSPVTLDVDAVFPPEATTDVTVKGNLPGVISGPLAEALSTTSAFLDGTQASISSTVAGPIIGGLTPNATYTMDIAIGNAPAQIVAATAGPGGTLDLNNVATTINAMAGVTAQVVGGVLEVTTDNTGEGASILFASSPTDDLAAAIGMPVTQVTGTQSIATNTTRLNDMTANRVDYVPGDVITITGVDTDGTAVNASFIYGAANDGETLQEFVDFAALQFNDAEVTLNTTGQLMVTAGTAGESDLLMSISDDAAAAGSSNWFEHTLTVIEEGTGPDEVVTTSEVFDSFGQAHTLTLTLQRQGDMSWNVMASLPEGSGTVITGSQSNPMTGLSFDVNGAPIGLGGVEKEILIQFTGANSSPQTISLDLGADGDFEGLTQFGSNQTVVADRANGHSDGTLSNLNVIGTGEIVGFYTNGQTRVLGAVGIASFNNQEGLEALGDNMFRDTVNTGNPRLGAGGTNGRGSVVSGSLEGSNVDTVEEFVHLIEAQRGFQANARVISTVDEVLAELANII